MIAGGERLDLVTDPLIGGTPITFKPRQYCYIGPAAVKGAL